MPAKKKETKTEEQSSTEQQTEEVKKTEETLVLRARKPLKEREFQLLSDLVKEEQEKTGMKIVLIPHSSELIDDGEE